MPRLLETFLEDLRGGTEAGVEGNAPDRGLGVPEAMAENRRRPRAQEGLGLERNLRNWREVMAGSIYENPRVNCAGEA